MTNLEANSLDTREPLLEGSRSGPWPRCESAAEPICGSDVSRDLSPNMPKGVALREVVRSRNGRSETLLDHIAEEVPIALIYNDQPFAVMMATPADVEDFARGFSLTESIVANAGELLAIDHRELLEGHEVRITIPAERAEALATRRRNLTGRSGCGMCGTEMLEAAMREPPRVPTNDTHITSEALQRALAQLPQHQPINALTGATHAAAFADLDGNIVLAREDIGRHNALDKLIGAMSAQALDPAHGFAVVTSRASYEIATKAAAAGIACIAAVSAPTALAIATAAQCNVRLIGFARGGAFVEYSRSGPSEGNHRA